MAVSSLSSMPMTSCMSYCILVLAASLQLVTARVGVRSLADNDSHDENNNNNYNNNDDNDGASQNSNIFTEFWNTYSQRLKDDGDGMWTSSPSEWGEEYWEVFAAISVILFGILLCFCVICCCVPCLIDDKNTRNHQVVMTQAELDAKKKKEASSLTEPILDGPSEDPPDPSTAPTYSPPATMGSNTDMSSDGAGLRTRSSIANATSMDSTVAPPPRTRSSKVKRKTIWSEVVEAWTEFLTEGYKAPDDVAPVRYKGEAFLPRDSKRTRGRKKYRLESQTDANVV